jgi:hypothetical protein
MISKSLVRRTLMAIGASAALCGISANASTVIGDGYA